jgi:uncharacterized OsmC-like protein
MSTITTAFPGFDTEKLEQFVGYATQNPNDVVLGIEAKAIWESEAGESLGKIGPWSLAGQRMEKPTRDYSIQFGAWKEVADAIGVEGARDKIEPVEAALAGMCACVTYAICINAAREGVSFEGLQVSARATVDPRVLLGIVPADEAASCLQSVDMDIEVKGDLTETDRNRIREMAKRSPVHALVTHPNTIHTSVKLSR